MRRCDGLYPGCSFLHPIPFPLATLGGLDPLASRLSFLLNYAERLEKEFLFAAILFIVLARSPHGFNLGYLGDGNIPP